MKSWFGVAEFSQLLLVCKAFDFSFMALGFLHVQFPPWELALSWASAVLGLYLAGAKLRLFQLG